MSKPRKKKRPPKRVLALPDLEQSKAAVLNSLTSKSGQRTYDRAINDFVEWYCSEPRLAFNRTVVLRYRIHLEQKGSCGLGKDEQARYSYRNATSGSTLVARRAGRSPDRSVTAISNAVAIVSASGSYGVSPNSQERATWLSAKAAGRPMATPRPVIRNTSCITSRSTFLSVAPSATRIPISRVLRATLYAVTPYKPTATSKIARKPKEADNIAINLSIDKDSLTCSCMDFNAKTGRLGSNPFTTLRKLSATS